MTEKKNTETAIFDEQFREEVAEFSNLVLKAALTDENADLLADMLWRVVDRMDEKQRAKWEAQEPISKPTRPVHSYAVVKLEDGLQLSPSADMGSPRIVKTYDNPAVAVIEWTRHVPLE